MHALFEWILATGWRAFVVFLVLFLLMSEWGFRVGRSGMGRDEPSKKQAASLQASLLGMFGLLLGFSFAMSVTRFDDRRDLMIREANSIGTAWLRAGLLPEPDAELVRQQLIEYIDLRLELVDPTYSEEECAEMLQACEAVQASLWAGAQDLARKVDPTPLSPLYVSALNDLIDLDTLRKASYRNQIPITVWLFLLIVASLVSWTTGHTTALGPKRRLLLPYFVLPALITMLLVLILDLDRPHRGLITVSKESMASTQKMLEKYMH